MKKLLTLARVPVLSLVARGGKNDKITSVSRVTMPSRPHREVSECKGEDLGLEDDPAFGCPFINTGVQIATIDDYKEVMGLE